MLTYKTHKVTAGDTLSKLAETYYGDAARYTEIAKANAIKYPFTIFVGQTLLIPTPKETDPLQPITVTSTRVPDYPVMPVPVFDELEVTASRFNPWLVAGLLLGALWVTDKKR